MKNRIVMLSTLTTMLLLSGCGSSTNQQDKGTYVTQKPALTAFSVNTSQERPIGSSDENLEQEAQLQYGEAVGALAGYADEDTSKFVITKAPEHGSVVLQENGYYHYVPNETFDGSDSFEYKTDIHSNCPAKKVDIRLKKKDDQATATVTELKISNTSCANTYRVTWDGSFPEGAKIVIAIDGRVVAIADATKHEEYIYMDASDPSHIIFRKTKALEDDLKAEPVHNVSAGVIVGESGFGGYVIVKWFTLPKGFLKPIEKGDDLEPNPAPIPVPQPTPQPQPQPQPAPKPDPQPAPKPELKPVLAPKVINRVDFDGTLDGVELDHNYVYATMGNVLEKIDVNDPLNVTDEQILKFEGDAYNIAFSHGKQVLALSKNINGLELLDMRDPSHPKTLSTLPDLQALGAVFSPDDSYLYVGNAWDGVFVYDVRDPNYPQKVGSYKEGHVAFLPVLSQDGQTLFVANERVGMLVLDVSDPAHPKKLSTFKTDGDAMSVTLSSDGNTAYIGADWNGIYIVDVSDPRNPRELAHLDLQGTVYTTTLDEEDNVLFVSSTGAGGKMKIVDISDPTSPTLLSTFDEIDSGVSMILRSEDKKKLYVVDDDRHLFVVDLYQMRHRVE